ncbi:hypothetical protein ONZ45_g3146 [Pleurotus djamor]|nr:hypothetical protein ONZ45_g3146 [Pleurotus djamor]
MQVDTTQENSQEHILEQSRCSAQCFILYLDLTQDLGADRENVFQEPDGTHWPPPIRYVADENSLPPRFDEQNNCSHLPFIELPDGLQGLQSTIIRRMVVNALFFAAIGAFLAPTVAVSPSFANKRQSGSFQLHPNGRTNKCLDVRANVQQSGTPVQIFDCNGSSAQNWEIDVGQTLVRLSGTTLCLDAGANPGNGAQMVVSSCSLSNLAGEIWVLTPDNRIALEGKGLCLDLPEGNTANGNFIQTWQCVDNDINQVWIKSTSGLSSIISATSAINPSSVVSRISITSINPSTISEVASGPSLNSTQMATKANALTSRKITEVTESPFKSLTAMDRVRRTGFPNPGNGTPMKIWTCIDNVPAQKWVYTLDDRLILQGTLQCLDLNNGDVTNANKVQMWECLDDPTFRRDQIWSFK